MHVRARAETVQSGLVYHWKLTMVKCTCMSSARRCADETPSDRRYLSKESVVFGAMDRLAPAMDIEHGDRLERCVDPSITASGTTVHTGSAWTNGDQLFRSPCYVRSRASIFQSPPIVGVVTSIGKTGLTKEMSTNHNVQCLGVGPVPLTNRNAQCLGVGPVPLTNRNAQYLGVGPVPVTNGNAQCLGVGPVPVTNRNAQCLGVGPVPVSSNTYEPVQANGLLKYSVRQTGVTPKPNNQPSSNHTGSTRKLYENLSEYGNKAPALTFTASNSEIYANNVVQKEFSLGYGSKNIRALPAYAETGQISIWSAIPTTFPCIAASKTVKDNSCEGYSNTCYLLKENVASDCTKVESPIKSERNSYDCLNGSLSLDTKTKAYLNGNDICGPSVTKQMEDTFNKSEDVYMLKENIDSKDVPQHDYSRYMVHGQNEVPTKEMTSKVAPSVLLPNKPHSNETCGNAQSAACYMDSKTSYDDSLNDNTFSLRKYGGDVTGSDNIRTERKHKYKNARMQITNRSQSPSYAYFKDKYCPRPKHRYYKNNAQTVNKCKSQSVSKRAFVSNSRSFTSPKESYGSRSNISTISNAVLASNSSLSTDQIGLGSRIKDARSIAVTSKLSSDEASGKSIAVLTKEKTRRKLAVPQRSAAQKDPYFRGATIWLQTLYKDGRSRLDISAFYSNVNVSLPRVRRGYTRMHGRIPDYPYSCSETEDMSPLYGRVRSPTGIAKTCASCRTRRTPLWRDAEDGTPLCNACGIRYKKYRLRCSKCWNIPKKDIKTYPNCPVCGGSLRYSFQRKTW